MNIQVSVLVLPLLVSCVPPKHFMRTNAYSGTPSTLPSAVRPATKAARRVPYTVRRDEFTGSVFVPTDFVEFQDSGAHVSVYASRFSNPERPGYVSWALNFLSSSSDWVFLRYQDGAALEVLSK